MARPDEVLQSVKHAIDTSGRLPDVTSYATFEMDTDGGQSDVRPPVVELTVNGVIRNNPNNTDLHHYATDSNGNQIGYVFRAQFDMEIVIDVWTAEGDGYSPDEIGREIRNALYQYDDKQLGKNLPDPNGGIMKDVTHFNLGNGSVENDLTMTPALRRWRQTADVWFHEEIDTSEEYGAEDYVVDVIVPEDGKMEAGTDVEIIFDATPNTESAADQY